MMSESKYDNIKVDGNVYQNTFKTAQNQPDHKGKIELDDDFLQKLVDVRKSGKKPVIDVAQWNRESKNVNQNTGKKTIYMWTSCEAIAGDPIEGESQVDETQGGSDEEIPF
tara:strand:+ start:5382 stop:5714 length:333 start_codon:yes stop_codon:yes gene_type:complete